MAAVVVGSWHTPAALHTPNWNRNAGIAWTPPNDDTLEKMSVSHELFRDEENLLVAVDDLEKVSNSQYRIVSTHFSNSTDEAAECKHWCHFVKNCHPLGCCDDVGHGRIGRQGSGLVK
jgi:hypothetical protein